MDQQSISQLEGKYGHIIVTDAKNEGSQDELAELYRFLAETLFPLRAADEAGADNDADNSKTE